MSANILALVLHFSALHTVDPYLIAAMIHVESSGNASMVGDAGEVGLMQIKPTTVNLSHTQLLNPRTNIKAGTKWLASLKNRCKWQVDYSYVVCYNHGVTGASRLKSHNTQYYKRVMKWRNNFINQDVFSGIR